MERAVSSTYLWCPFAGRGQLVPPPLAGRAVAGFLILMPPPLAGRAVAGFLILSPSPQSPNQKAAYDNYEGTCAAHQLEVDKGWTAAWSKAPYAVTMHVCQTNVVPKSNGTMRLLGNPSHPEPGTVGWLIEGLPVAPNRATDWDQMPGYEWASIEEFAAAMAIVVAITVMARGWAEYEQLADILALLVVCGSRDDLTKWFRQIPLCTLDMHKQVYHWAGRYLVDQHVQMGRVSSADGAQRLSMVAKAILFQRAEARLRELLAAAATALWQFLARIVEYRRVQLGSVNTDLWCIDLMQDDLAWVAITVEVGTIVREMTVSVLAEYGIEVSVEKRAEDEAAIGGVQPNAVVLFIGARFDATDLRHVRVRGQDKTVERLAQVMDEWTTVRAGGRVRRVLLCRTIGMLMFQGRFGRRFRRRLNSGIRLLRGGGEMFAHVSAEWLRDVASMWAEVQLAQGVPLTLDPVWWHPGLRGCCEFLQCTVLGKHGAVSDDATLRGRDVIFFLTQAKIISRCRYVPGMPRPGVSK